MASWGRLSGYAPERLGINQFLSESPVIRGRLRNVQKSTCEDLAGREVESANQVSTQPIVRRIALRVLSRPYSGSLR
jgi:hypothetical protein